MRNRILKYSLFFSLMVFMITPLLAQELISKKGYQEPPEPIKKIVLAPRHENISLSNLSPDQESFLNTKGDGLIPVARLGSPYMNLGGVQVDTVANRSRSLTTGGSVGFDLIPAMGGAARQIQVPANARVSSPSWSPDGKKVAYFAHFKDATHIYVATVATGRSVKITPRPVLATMNTSFGWSADGKYILTVLIPEKRQPKPQQYVLDNHLRVRVTSEGKNQLRTVLHLLEDSWEEALFEYYCTGQITRITVDNPKQLKNVGTPGIYSAIDFAPDGKHLMVTTTVQPFSNIVPVSSFGNKRELWDIDGKVLSEISKRELSTGLVTAATTRPTTDPDDDSPRGGDREPQKRSLRWRPDGQGLSYMTMDPAPARRPADSTAVPADTTKPADPPKKRMDRVYQWLPPYGTDDAKVIYETETQIGSLNYSEDCKTLFMTETVSGQSHLFMVNLDEPTKKHTIYKYRTSDFYANPGSLLMTSAKATGESVVRISSDKSSVYLSGTTYHKEWKENAPRPFVDRINVKTGEKSRLFESAADKFERVTTVFDDDFTKVIVVREAPTVIADSYLKDLKAGTEVKLTNNIDFTPEITNAQYHLVEVERADGIKFLCKVVLPQNWNGERLPTMFWFYPSEFTDQESIDRGKRTTNINSFRSTGVRSMQNLTTLGYAFVEPDFPIVGTAGRMNDNYVPDTQKNWAAILDVLSEKGYIDRNRLALGGHSYGAFSTANSMIYTPYFKAGIAGDGAYNRTLTPMSFQSERRVLWEARELYLEMSPLLHVERMTGALLMYHGGDDNNVGTWLINSERMFMALNGLDKAASLYIYPYEDHGPAGKETQLDMWARWVEWLDFYVKNPVKKESKKPAPGNGR
jgi:dipeptidyl aminopeptidase/acylaminoacyl peptidase